MSGRVLLLSLCAILAVASGPVRAQTPLEGVPAAERHARWYQEQLLELSRSLGGAHYLRLSCARNDYSWFNFMEGVLAREAQPTRRALENAFNDGYRRERARFSRCTPQAQQMEAELRSQGMRAADALGAVYDEVSPP
jgi:uncharacterized protein (TIGR02301 family)